jgi:hypothetical protein
MFRPSRPMIRPFISSFGRVTTVIVASEVWSAAMRCMTVVRIRRERSSPSSCPSLDLAHAVLRLGLGLVHDLADERLASLGDGQARDALELDDLLLLELAQARELPVELTLALPQRLLALLVGGHLAIERLLPVQEAALGALQVARCSRASSSAARRRWIASSLPSRTISFCLARASATSRWAYCSA